MRLEFDARARIYVGLFLAVQVIGSILPRFANFHSNVFPALLGMLLLMPGGVIPFAFGSLPDWAMIVAIYAVNACAWFALWCWKAHRLFAVD